MKKIYFSASLLCASLGVSHAQVTEVYFKYDEAGSQKYRGPEDLAGKASKQLKTVSLATTQVMDEKSFWKQVEVRQGFLR